jgi:hypothetical protein
VLKVYADSKNRVWILPFTNAICYYENGIIYNARNDTTLAKIKFKSEPFGIKEDAEGILLLSREQ